MARLNDDGTDLRDRLSRSHGVSPDAVTALIEAVARGGGQQAQFSHPDLGGMGQWSAGGMTMVGDMFNTSLQAQVANLCAEIAAAYHRGALFDRQPQAAGSGQYQSQGGPSLRVPGGGQNEWWPEDLGHPSSSGAQNNLAYAIFPARKRLAINLGGRVTVYDTGDHLIGGIGQQQSGDASWTFTSQHGTVHLADLPVVSGGAAPGKAASADKTAPQREGPDAPRNAAPAPQGDAPAPDDPPPAALTPPPSAGGQIRTADEIFAALEKLGALRDKGILDEPEFLAKKAELLARL